MKFKDNVKLKEIKALVGKKASFRTARGPSLPHVIDSVEFTKDGIVLVLKREHVALTKRRKLAQVELIKETVHRAPVEEAINPKAKKIEDLSRATGATKEACKRALFEARGDEESAKDALILKRNLEKIAHPPASEYNGRDHPNQ